MRGNRYLERLISDYNKYNRIVKSSKLFSSEDELRRLMDEVDPKLLAEVAKIFEKRYRKNGIDLSKIDLDESQLDVLKRDIARKLLEVSGACGSAKGRSDCEKLVDEVIELAKEINAKNYSRIKKLFSIQKIADSYLGHIGRRLAPIIFSIGFAISKVVGANNPNDILENAKENRTAIVAVENIDFLKQQMQKKITGQAENLNLFLEQKTRRKINDPDELRIVDDIINRKGEALLVAYDVIHTAAGQMPDAELKKEQATENIYISVRNIYKYLLNYKHGIEMRKILGTETAKGDLSKEDIMNLWAMIITSEAFTRICSDFGLRPQDVINAIRERKGFDAQFLDNNGKPTEEITDEMYIYINGQSFVIRLIKIDLGIPSEELDKDEKSIRNGTIALSKQDGMVYLFIEFPIGMRQGSGIRKITPLFAVKIQTSPFQSDSNVSNASIGTGISNRYIKNKRLFSKKKYEWM